MPGLSFGCISATPFAKGGGFDEEGVRGHARRLISAGIEVYMGSGGNGESHSMTEAELLRMYQLTAEECKGKVSCEAHLPEEGTAAAMRHQAEIAIKGGVDIIQLCSVESRHGMRPSERELTAYYDQVLSELDHPTKLIVSPVVGHVAPINVIADVCNRHKQIMGVMFARVPDAYLMDLRGMVNRRLQFTFQFLTSSVNAFVIGADGLFSAEANILPKTARRFIDLYEAKDLKTLGDVFAHLTYFRRHVQKWAPAGGRWIKMAMRVLKLPGGEGGVRPPYMFPPEEEMQRFTDGLLKLRIPEIDEMAKAAGLKIP